MYTGRSGRSGCPRVFARFSGGFIIQTRCGLWKACQETFSFFRVNGIRCHSVHSVADERSASNPSRRQLKAWRRKDQSTRNESAWQERSSFQAAKLGTCTDQQEEAICCFDTDVYLSNHNVKVRHRGPHSRLVSAERGSALEDSESVQRVIFESPCFASRRHCGKESKSGRTADSPPAAGSHPPSWKATLEKHQIFSLFLPCCVLLSISASSRHRYVEKWGRFPMSYKHWSLFMARAGNKPGKPFLSFAPSDVLFPRTGPYMLRHTGKEKLLTSSSQEDGNEELTSCGWFPYAPSCAKERRISVLALSNYFLSGRGLPSNVTGSRKHAHLQCSVPIPRAEYRPRSGSPDSCFPARLIRRGFQCHRCRHGSLQAESPDSLGISKPN
jgi:hypothetical protein